MDQVDVPAPAVAVVEEIPFRADTENCPVYLDNNLFGYLEWKVRLSDKNHAVQTIKECIRHFDRFEYLEYGFHGWWRLASGIYGPVYLHLRNQNDINIALEHVDNLDFGDIPEVPVVDPLLEHEMLMQMVANANIQAMNFNVDFELPPALQEIFNQGINGNI